MLCEPTIISTEDTSVIPIRYFQAMYWKNFIVSLAKYKQIPHLCNADFKSILLSPHAQITVASRVLPHAEGQFSSCQMLWAVKQLLS